MNIQRWSPSKRASTFTPLVHIDGAVRDSDDTSLVPLPEAMPHSSGAPRKAGALKFFLVEDNDIIRENLAETLHEMVGAEVVGISDIQSEATRWLCDPTHEWDVAIIDIFLKQGKFLFCIGKNNLS